MRDVAVLMACLLLGGGAQAAALVPVTDEIPVVTVPGARPSPRPLPVRLVLPPGPGPHPVVILLHGCSGVGTNQAFWTKRLVSWGYGALVLDSLTPRGIRSVCAHADQPLVTRQDRAGDVIAAVRWLQTARGVDGARIGVLGNSHGGATAATVANRHFQAEANGLIKAVVDYYGACREPAGHGTIPLLALAGEDDSWSRPAAACRRFAQEVGSAEDITVRTYPGVVHGFDNPRLAERRWSEGHPMQYAPEAAEASFADVHAFLNRTIGRR
ncbi:putative Carboxymethylenebutenolidase [Rhodovastum atsumiense]|nr:dienelactone hydrolase family protein [Rhodovastum atsumiense]CAH2604515.1 putative Carboxymethylenebutenolidase [Rhodovastum atsumiense]